VYLQISTGIGTMSLRMHRGMDSISRFSITRSVRHTRDNEINTFYSTKSDAPFVDVGHFLLEAEIDVEIDPKGDPVSSADHNNLDSLRKHHRSILEHIHYQLGAGDIIKPYTIENSWTMKVEDTTAKKMEMIGKRLLANFDKDYYIGILDTVGKRWAPSMHHPSANLFRYSN
jgi:hypothetical protein